jgi:hypothetical protein
MVRQPARFTEVKDGMGRHSTAPGRLRAQGHVRRDPPCATASQERHCQGTAQVTQPSSVLALGGRRHTGHYEAMR